MNPVYVEQVINPLKELFLQDSFDEIPDIIINQNSDLGLISSNVASFAVNIKQHESEDDQIKDIFTSIGDYFNDDRNINRLSIIDKTSKSFALALEQSYSVLNTQIIPLANDITEKIVNRYHQLMIREKAENLITDDQTEPSEGDFLFIDWNSKQPSEIAEIIEIACDNANINVKELSPSNLSYVIAKINFFNDMKKIDLPDDLQEDIIKKLVEVFGQHGLSDTIVTEYFYIITRPNIYLDFCNRIVTKINDTRNSARTCLDFIQTVRSAMKFIHHSKQVVSDMLNPETLQDLANNVDVFTKTIFAIKYWLLFMKEHVFEDKLVVAENIINKPVYEKFVKEGKTISDVYKYLKAFNIGTTIPVSGISSKAILDADTDDRLKKINERIESNSAYIKTKCLIEAFEFGIRAFVEEPSALSTFPELEQNANTRFAFIQFATAGSSILKGSIDNVNDELVRIIVTFFYKNNIISSLYRYLGKNFSDLVSEEGDIDNSAILQSQCSAVTELLIDFLYKTGVCE